MRIAFLCGGLGFGGVADYTRHLAAALKPHGVESLIVGLADRDASEVTRSSGALALPGRLSWPARIEQAEAEVESSSVSLGYFRIVSPIDPGCG